MADSLEELRRGPVARRPSAPVNQPSEEEDECPAFGYLRGTRDQVTHLSLRLADGSVTTMPYSWLGPCRYHPSVGLVMLFAGGDLFLVTLRGRNLDTPLESGVSLYERGLMRHRVVWIREATAAEARSLPDGVCVVERIDIRTVTADEVVKALGFVKAGSLREG